MLFITACRSYDISILIYQDEVKKQIAAGNLRVRVNEEQIPYVADLLLDEDPLIRLAALKIMENNRYDDFLVPLLETTLDEDDLVSTEAFRILEAYPDWTLLFLEESLEGLGDLLCLNALKALATIGELSSRQVMISLFSSESDRKKNGAARTLAGLVELESPLMWELIHSEDPFDRAGYYRIVGHYGDSSLIPLLFEGLGDEDPQVWGACISAIYQFGEEALPYVDENIHSEDYLMSLSCLQILEAIKSEESLPLLISFYTNTNHRLVQKAAIIVKSYGARAVPYLSEGIREGDDYNNRIILWTLREINSPLALPLYLKLLDLQVPVLEEDILTSLSALGKEVWDDLRLHVSEADDEVAVTLVSLLAGEGDLGLIDDETCAFYLISRVDSQDFDVYFPMSGAGEEVEEDFRSLKRALVLNRVINVSLNSSNRYFTGYRDLLQREKEADEALEQSLKLRRQGDSEGSARLMDQYESLSRKMDFMESALDRLPLEEQKAGEELILQYLEAQEELTDIRIAISPRFRGLADRIYNELIYSP